LTARRAARCTQLAQEAQLIRLPPAVITAVAVAPLPVETQERVEVLTHGALDLHRTLCRRRPGKRRRSDNLTVLL